MYHHVKKLMYTVCVDEPDPRFGNMLLEQFEGANGELAAAMQYSVQGINCEDPARKDLLMDNGAAVDVRRENAGRCEATNPALRAPLLSCSGDCLPLQLWCKSWRDARRRTIVRSARFCAFEADQYT